MQLLLSYPSPCHHWGNLSTITDTHERCEEQSAISARNLGGLMLMVNLKIILDAPVCPVFDPQILKYHAQFFPRDLSFRNWVLVLVIKSFNESFYSIMCPSGYGWTVVMLHASTFRSLLYMNVWLQVKDGPLFKHQIDYEIIRIRPVDKTLITW